MAVGDSYPGKGLLLYVIDNGTNKNFACLSSNQISITRETNVRDTFCGRKTSVGDPQVTINIEGEAIDPSTTQVSLKWMKEKALSANPTVTLLVHVTGQNPGYLRGNFVITSFDYEGNADSGSMVTFSMSAECLDSSTLTTTA